MNESKLSSEDTAAATYHRSPLLLDRRRSSLLVVDVQEKLFPLVRNHAQIGWNIRRLLDGAKLLDVPRAGTEQYPRGLGPTIAPLRERLSEIPDKRMFSCRECRSIFDAWQRQALQQMVLVGIEAHVCVLQTALDALAMGFDVYAVVDAVGSRRELDEQVGLRRIEQAGGTLVSTESVLFEWCESAAIPEFKQISDLVRETGP